MTGPERKPLMTPAEVAHEFHVDPKTVTRWARSGKLPKGEAWIITPGGHRRYVRAYIEKYLPGAQETSAPAEPAFTNYLACGDTITGPVSFEPGSPVHCAGHGVTKVTAWAQGSTS